MMKEQKSKFFKHYFIVMIIWAILGLIDSFFISGTKETFGQINITYTLFIGLLDFAIVILSLIAIIIFIQNKFSKISLVLPIYDIVGTILYVLYGVILGLLSSIQGRPLADQFISPELITISIISSLFELVFSIYILNRFKYKAPSRL